MLLRSVSRLALRVRLCEHINCDFERQRSSTHRQTLCLFSRGSQLRTQSSIEDQLQGHVKQKWENYVVNQYDIRKEQHVYLVGVEGRAPVIGNHIGGKTRSSDMTPAPRDMVPTQLARRVIGSRVCTKDTFVAARAECARQFGSAASSKFVDGTVLEVIVERPKAVRKLF
jgi:hypothetical protein